MRLAHLTPLILLFQSLIRRQIRQEEAGGDDGKHDDHKQKRSIKGGALKLTTHLGIEQNSENLNAVKKQNYRKIQ